VRVSRLPAGARQALDARRILSASWKYLPAFALVTLLFVWPLVSVFALSFGGETPFANYTVFFESTGYRKALANTFEISLQVTLGCLALGFPYAWCMINASRGVTSALLAMLMIPLWTSMLVRTYAWLLILNPKGIVNNALIGAGLIDAPLDIVHNRIGVLIGMTQILLPFFVLPLYAVMRGFDMRLLRAAKSLGASPARAFTTVFIPGVAPGLIAGLLLVFVVSIGFFITPALLGGASDTMLSQLIEQQFSVTLNWGLGATMATILLAATIVLLVIAGLIIRPRGKKRRA
jgi:putative spermidine/putrescine transport system permease protein